MSVDLKSCAELFEMPQREILQRNLANIRNNVGTEMIPIIASSGRANYRWHSSSDPGLIISADRGFRVRIQSGDARIRLWPKVRSFAAIGKPAQIIKSIGRDFCTDDRRLP